MAIIHLSYHILLRKCNHLLMFVDSQTITESTEGGRSSLRLREGVLRKKAAATAACHRPCCTSSHTDNTPKGAYHKQYSIYYFIWGAFSSEFS